MAQSQTPGTRLNAPGTEHSKAKTHFAVFSNFLLPDHRKQRLIAVH
jgi:hypothetical protein